jgi:hypothetical protein
VNPVEPIDVTDAEETLTMSLAPAECLDDRPPSSPGRTSRQLAETSAIPAAATHSDEAPGLRLQRRREERGLTLDDLWRSTKINRPVLRAIETSDVLHLPAAIYTRGFVKAYAREVGLDPDSTADEYLRRIEPLRSQHLLVDDGRLPPLADHPAPIDANGDARQLLAVNQMRRFSRLSFVIAAAGLVFYISSFYRAEPRLPAPARDGSGEQAVSDAVAARQSEGGESVTADAADAMAAAVGDSSLRVELVPQGLCWVSARVDGERVVSKLLRPGERQTLHISDEAVLRVGEPGALSFSINGQSGRPLGPAGQPITVRITRDNFRDFLSS